MKSSLLQMTSFSSCNFMRSLLRLRISGDLVMPTSTGQQHFEWHFEGGLVHVGFYFVEYHRMLQTELFSARVRDFLFPCHQLRCAPLVISTGCAKLSGERDTLPSSIITGFFEFVFRAKCTHFFSSEKLWGRFTSYTKMKPWWCLSDLVILTQSLRRCGSYAPLVTLTVVVEFSFNQKGK